MGTHTHTHTHTNTMRLRLCWSSTKHKTGTCTCVCVCVWLHSCVQVSTYLLLLTQLSQVNTELRTELHAPKAIVPFLNPGRLVRVLPALPNTKVCEATYSAHTHARTRARAHTQTCVPPCLTLRYVALHTHTHTHTHTRARMRTDWRAFCLPCLTLCGVCGAWRVSVTMQASLSD